MMTSITIGQSIGNKETREPDASKVARPVRRGAGGKGQKDLARMPTLLVPRFGFRARLKPSVRQQESNTCQKTLGA